MKLSLKNRFLLPTVIMVILGLGISAGVSMINARGALNDSIESQLTQLTNTASGSLDEWIRRTVVELEAAAKDKTYKSAISNDFMGKAARKTANIKLAEFIDQYGFYEGVSIMDSKGTCISSTVANAIGASMPDDPHFKKAMSGETSISTMFTSHITNRMVFMIDIPITVKDKVNGVLLGTIDMAAFHKLFIDPIKVGETGFAYIYDNQGVVISHPDKSKLLNMNMKDYEYGQRMLEQEKGLISFTHDGMEKTAAYHRVKATGWTIAIQVDTADIMAPVDRMAYINIIIAVAVVLIIGGVIFMIALSVTRPVHKIVQGLNEASNQVAAGAGQVSETGQKLAEGSSEQAASLEETSSSLEEMSTMTRLNADNANQAKSMMTEASQILDKVTKHMGEMGESIEEITRSSEETGKIIKTIDEIAFQTNLLALNAAVEAARAGEAGAGFAVVADEVRNLAMRAAEAAKNTAELIENTIRAVQNGNELTQSTQEAFSENVDISIKVNGLVEEIAAASNEQAQGIEQVNRAVVEMDRVVQGVAVSAEESASASEEMNAQAEQMRHMIDDLVTLISGSDNNRRSSGISVQLTESNSGTQELKKATKKLEISKAKEISPKDVIPMSNTDFSEL